MNVMKQPPIIKGNYISNIIVVVLIFMFSTVWWNTVSTGIMRSFDDYRSAYVVNNRAEFEKAKDLRVGVIAYQFRTEDNKDYTRVYKYDNRAMINRHSRLVPAGTVNDPDSSKPNKDRLQNFYLRKTEFVGTIDDKIKSMENSKEIMLIVYIIMNLVISPVICILTTRFYNKKIQSNTVFPSPKSEK